MPALTPQQEKRVEGIAAIVKEFMDARFEHALRINPHIGPPYADLSWQQLVTLRQILAEDKAFGPVRFRVCDILASDDEAKKQALFSPTDQNSIMNEILNLSDQVKETRAGILNIRDIKTFYTALDPSLSRIVELIQTWIWWDLPDAADIFSFEQEYQRILKLAKQPLTDKIIDFYRKAMKRTTEAEITLKDILEYEINKLEHIVKRLKQRNEAEPGYQMILKRDEESTQAIDEMIVSLAKHINNLKKIQETPEINDEIRNVYAKILQIPPADVTRNIIIHYEENSINQLKQKLRDTLNMGRVLGTPYNYKTRRIQEIERRFEQLKKALLPEKTEVAPAAAAG